MLPWTSFTCYTKDNQQGCFRLSNWFSLRRLGPWMNHLPPAWYSTFRLTFQNESWYVSLEWYFIYLLFLPLFTVSCMKPVIFYSVKTFPYTKCFVHPYTIDVVCILSYLYILLGLGVHHVGPLVGCFEFWCPIHWTYINQHNSYFRNIQI